MTENEVMKFYDLIFEQPAYIRAIFKDGTILTGRLIDVTSSWDNDDEGSYITFVPAVGPLAGRYVMGLDYELAKVEVIGWNVVVW